MAFDKKAYNKWYYQRNKNRWKQYNDWRGSGAPVGRGINNQPGSFGMNPDATKVNQPGGKYEGGRYVPTPKPNPPKDTSRKIIVDPTWKDKMNAAYADASYKSNRRRTKTYSPTVSEFAQYHRDADRRKMNIAKANYNRRNAESMRSYAVGKSTLRSESKPKSGIIPRALRSYGSYYKIGVKSIGNSLSKAPTKIKKKLTNFFNKWLKW